jgi:hypothetical protein
MVTDSVAILLVCCSNAMQLNHVQHIQLLLYQLVWQ